MSKSDFLMIFRRCSSPDTLEIVAEQKRIKSAPGDLIALESAYDHRKAEIFMKRLYDRIPASVWTYIR